MKKKQILPNIYLIEFQTSEEAARTFIRFQEHYESPEFRNKIFTLPQYEKWYKKRTKKTEFTYYTDWRGFNIPSYVLQPFYSGAFKDLTDREKALLDLFKNVTGQYYIIGVPKGNKATLKHEIMHGLYFTNPKYRAQVDLILGGANLKDVFKFLRKKGYHEGVLQDEAHAYLVTCMEMLVVNKIYILDHAYVITDLEELYNKTVKKK